jgi:hypothetical protein
LGLEEQRGALRNLLLDEKIMTLYDSALEIDAMLGEGGSGGGAGVGEGRLNGLLLESQGKHSEKVSVS